MKAIGYKQSLPITDLASLIDIEIPQPNVLAHDLLVRIKAIAVNPVDCKIRQNVAAEEGKHKVIGWDAVGEVIAIGDSVTHFKIGDSVFYAGDLNRQGCNAEYQLVDERIVGNKPKSLSDSEAAALPLTSITAWELLFERLAIKQQLPTSKEQSKDIILIVGAAGGVGSILVQLASKLTSALIIGTASREESQKWVTDLGADHVIDHRQPLSEELERIGITHVYHVISLNATEQHFSEIAKVIAPQGSDDDLALVGVGKNIDFAFHDHVRAISRITHMKQRLLVVKGKQLAGKCQQLEF